MSSAQSRCYKIIVAYDGTDYEGWQIQPSGFSIANNLQAAYERAFKESVRIEGASRTDAGVHSMGQVAIFTTRVELESERILQIWNKNLPSGIVIRSLEVVAHGFHPRANVAQKTYYYHFFLQRPLPFVQRFGYTVTGKFDKELLVEALNIFKGTHDFRSFCKAPGNRSTVRTIEEIFLGFNDELGAYQIVIRGKSFLHHMIRRIVGASFQIALGQKPLEKIKIALAIPQSMQELLNAPPLGLLLYKITYTKDIVQ